MSVFPVPVLIDPGSAVNLINSNLVQELNLLTIPCTPPLQVTTINDQPIGKGILTHTTAVMELQIGLFHYKKLAFFIIPSPFNLIVLRLPWLQLQEPCISSKEGELKSWSEFCLRNCFFYCTPLPLLKALNPHSLCRFQVNTVICRFSARRRPLSCRHTGLGTAPSISSLTPCPPKSRIYPLSLPEKKAMTIEEALAAGYMHPSTSPSRVFLCGKEGWRPSTLHRLLWFELHQPTPIHFH